MSAHAWFLNLNAFSSGISIYIYIFFWLLKGRRNVLKMCGENWEIGWWLGVTSTRAGSHVMCSLWHVRDSRQRTKEQKDQRQLHLLPTFNSTSPP